MNCKATEQQLTRYALSDLDPDSAAMVTAHLESCPTCSGELSRIERTLDLLCRALARPAHAPVRLSPAHRSAIFSGEPAVSEPPQPWIFRPHRALAAAAAVLIMVGVFSGLLSMFSAVKHARVRAPADSSVWFEEETVPHARYALEDMPTEEPSRPVAGLTDEISGDEALPEPDYAATPPPPPSVMPVSRAGEPAPRPSLSGAAGDSLATMEQQAIHMPKTEPAPKKTAPATGGRDGTGDADKREHGYAARHAFGRRQPTPPGAAAAKTGSRPDAGKPAGGPATDGKTYFDAFDGKLGNGAEATEAEKEEVDGELRARAYGVNPFRTAAQHGFSTFSIDVDTASYTLARNYMSRGLLPPPEAVRTEEFVNFFDYGYKAPEHETFRVYVKAAPSEFGRGLHLLKIGVKGRRLGREEQRPAMLTFLIDTSGSMNQADRLGLVRKSLRLLVEKLGARDRVAIVQYDSHARLVLEPTAASEKKKILAAIDGMQCGGSTNLEEGMARAYTIAAKYFVPGGENRVLLLSDGVANLGAVAAEDILKQVEGFRRQGITCSVFGFGMGSYDDEMLETLANKGDGNYAFVDSEAEARRVFVDDLAATLNTVAADVKIQVEFNPRRVRRYRQLGYENRQLRDEQFRDDTVDAGEVGSGQSVTALYELELAGGESQISDLKSRNAAELHTSNRGHQNGSTSQASNLRFQNLGTVRVRYRRLDTGAVEEIAQPIRPRDMAKRFRDADSRLRLAACVAEFAEILRGSPFAAGSEYAHVAEELRPVALELSLDARVQEVLRLVSGANGLGQSAIP